MSCLRVSAASHSLFLLMCFQLPFSLSGNLKEPEQKGFFFVFLIAIIKAGAHNYHLLQALLSPPIANSVSHEHPKRVQASYRGADHRACCTGASRAVARGCSRLGSGDREPAGCCAMCWKCQNSQESCTHTRVS